MRRLVFALVVLGVLFVYRNGEQSLSLGSQACDLLGCRNSLIVKVAALNPLPEKLKIVFGEKTIVDECQPSHRGLGPEAKRINSREVMIAMFKDEKTAEMPSVLNVRLLGRGSCDLPEEPIFQVEDAPISYEKFFPNGKECGGDCRTAMLHLSER